MAVQEAEVFEQQKDENAPAGPGLLVDLEGYEGPLDVLLALARDQKVDLARISILTLADQYLVFIAQMRPDQLEQAADYLVMAAWLAFLKSRLLLPEPPADEQPSGEELAAALQFQLARLEAIRKAAELMMRQPRLNRDIFARGAPEEIPEGPIVYKASLYDLLKAYAAHRSKKAGSKTLRIEAFDLYSVDDALARLRSLVGKMPSWSSLVALLPPGLSGLLRRSAISSHLVAVLELAKQGKLDVYQEGAAFTPIWVREAGEKP